MENETRVLLLYRVNRVNPVGANGCACCATTPPHHQRKLPITCFKLHTLRIPWNDGGHRAERSVENFAQNVQLLLLGAGNGPSKSFAVYQTL